jgi:hypothetical protein
VFKLENKAQIISKMHDEIGHFKEAITLFEIKW